MHSVNEDENCDLLPYFTPKPAILLISAAYRGDYQFTPQHNLFFSGSQTIIIY